MSRSRRRPPRLDSSRTPLQQQIEAIEPCEPLRPDQVDRVDDDIESFVGPLLEQFRALPPLEQVDLMSSESASHAIPMLEERLEILGEFRRRVDLLKNLLEARKARITSH